MTMSEEAVQRLRTALEDLEHKRREHNQRIWLHAPIGNYGIAKVTCGSSMCLAGDVLLNDGGYQFVVPPWTPLAPGATHFLEYVIRNEDLDWWKDTFQRVTDDEDEENIHDRMQQIPDVARELLDLEENDAEALFSADNPLELLWAYGWHLSGGRIPLPQRILDMLPTHDGKPSMTWNAVYVAAEAAHAERVG